MAVNLMESVPANWDLVTEHFATGMAGADSQQRRGPEQHARLTVLLQGGTKGKKLKEVDLANIEDLNQELEVADSIQTCCGTGLLHEFLPLEVQPSSTVRIWDNQLVAQKCAMSVHSAGSSCLNCRLFSDEVLRGVDLHHKTVEQNCGSYSATVKFVCLINKLIQVMTSRCPDDALRPQTPEATFIDDFLSFLADWEEKAKEKARQLLRGCGLRWRAPRASWRTLDTWIMSSS
ncbi:hypothetical protein ISCGN_018344 [Ixodes scapularis]